MKSFYEFSKLLEGDNFWPASQGNSQLSNGAVWTDDVIPLVKNVGYDIKRDQILVHLTYGGNSRMHPWEWWKENDSKLPPMEALRAKDILLKQSPNFQRAYRDGPNKHLPMGPDSPLAKWHQQNQEFNPTYYRPNPTYYRPNPKV